MDVAHAAAAAAGALVRGRGAVCKGVPVEDAGELEQAVAAAGAPQRHRRQRRRRDRALQVRALRQPKQDTLSAKQLLVKGAQIVRCRCPACGSQNRTRSALASHQFS